MPNTIHTDQNVDSNLKHFVASRVWYLRGRRVAFTQVAIAFGVPLATAVLLPKHPDWKVWTSTAGITASILDTIFLDRLQRKFRTNGANEQELFDCEVLNIDWPHGLAGSPPSATDAADAAGKHDPAPYRDWYPDVSPIDVLLGALVCQQCNSWWDAKLRDRYTKALWIALAVVVVGLGILGFRLGLPFEQELLTIYAPVSPMIMWTVREALRQSESQQLSRRTQALADSAWKEALQSQAPNRAAVRDLQNAIYQRRKSSPFIPTFLQKMQQNSYRDTMLSTARHMVDDALRAQKKRVLPATHP